MNFFIVSAVFGAIQISVWRAFPKRLTRFLFKIPMLAVMANAAGSILIMKVAGTSAFIGSANLAGSLIFAIWVLILKGGAYEEKSEV